ncbi:MAG: EAL domain-containing protein [Hydrogenovibrio sp.]
MDSQTDYFTFQAYQACLSDRHFFYTHDAAGIFTYLTPSVTQVLGYQPHEILTHYSEFLTDHPKNEAVHRHTQALLKGEKSQAYTVEIYHKNGGKRWLQVQEFAERNAEGHAIAIHGLATDITDYHHTLQQLETQTQRFQRAEAMAKVGSWELNHVSQALYWSQEVYRIFELNAQSVEASYQCFIDRVHPDDRDKVEQAYQQSLQQQTPYRIDHRLRLPDGRIKFVREEGLTDFDTHGQPLMSSGTIQDMTDYYHAQHALQKQKTLLRSVINATSDLIFIKDAMGVYQGCNPAFERFVGRSEAEIIGQTDFDLFNQAVAEAFSHQDDVIFDRGDARHHEEWLTYPDGQKMLVDTLKTPFYGEDGNVSGLVGVSRDITARKEAEEKLYFLAHHDDLTGLVNRYLFTSLLEQAIAHSERNGELLAVLFIDLDHFKQINDSLGHQVGDQVLEQVGKCLQSSGRKSDTIARLGGDEFAFSIRDLSGPEDASVVAEKILEVLEKPFRVEGHKLYIGASIGISLYPHNGTNADVLLRNADAAMYRAKDNDRNTYAFYTEELTQIAFQHIQLESELRRAIQNNEFELYYQPKYECHSRRIVGSEALIRWHHPTRGLLMPGQFIAEAEKSDLIIELGEWVLRQACTQNAQWHRMGLKSGRVAVNISGKQITKHDLSQTVQTVLAETDCKPKWLELEIIERFVMSSPEQALSVLNDISQTGVAFAIDDFGIEYSSLSYLKQMPLNTLKIDLSFIRDIPEDKDDMAIVEAMLGLAKSFNLMSVAEGVERPEQLEFLRTSGADRFQGFLMSKPMPAHAFEALLKTHPTL